MTVNHLMEVRVLPGQQNSGIIVSVLPPPLQRYTGAGIVAQSVEHLVEDQGVVGSIPTDTTESRYNGKPPLPYGSRSINPVKWGKIKTLNVVSDTDSSYLRRGDGCESGLKRVHLKPTLIGLNMVAIV
jgi:hypothetical protein